MISEWFSDNNAEWFSDNNAEWLRYFYLAVGSVTLTLDALAPSTTVTAAKAGTNLTVLLPKLDITTDT